MNEWRFFWVFAFCFLMPGLAVSAESADGVILNANIITVNSKQPSAEAIAWKDGRIISVGGNADVRRLVGEGTQVIQADHATVVPGFIESHGHFSSMGYAKMNLELREDQSWDSIVAKVEAAAQITPAGEWIVGRGWHQEKWTKPLERHVEGYPLHDELSAVSPDHPVILTHASGHMAIANAVAMRMAGIDSETPDPDGGEILRDAAGRATGVLRETAEGIVLRRYEASMDSGDSWNRAVELAARECLENGITSFHDAGSKFAEIDRYRTAVDNGQISVRLWIMVRDRLDRLSMFLPRYRMIGYGDNFLTVRAIKQSLDGALGSHGAWLMEPYEDLPTNVGMNTMPMDDLRATVDLAAKHDYQLCVHAIGDRANHEVLNLFESRFSEDPSERSRRWRIEHAQHLLVDDIPRFGQLGVIAAMQGIHCTSDAVFVGLRLGQRRAATGAYMWRSLLDSGAVICNGTDAPVEDVNPLASFYASVTRRTKDGIVFYGDQKMTRYEALKSYTLDAAYAGFEDEEKGSLSVGKLADIVILSKDLLTCDEREILETKVLRTIVGGQTQFESAP